MMRALTFVLLATVVVALAMLPLALSPFHTRVAQLFFFSAALATAWNILGGFAGYWSFGHTVFIGIGGFAAALFTMKVGSVGTGPVSMIVPVLVGGVVCAVFAAIIAYPILRLRGIYFAIAMLGVGQVVGELVNNIGWFQGGMGVFLAPAVPSGVPAERYYYWIFGALLVLAIAIAAAVKRSHFGYGLLAIREDEDTAQMLGVPTERYKASAFVLSATLVGVLGAVYAYSVGYFTTYTVFRMDFSLNMIVFCLIGGIGTLSGPLIGTATMLVITQLLLSRLLEVHLLVTGLIVVAIILVMPGGIVGAVSKRLRSARAAGGERP